jgi:hypothetical protein
MKFAMLSVVAAVASTASSHNLHGSPLDQDTIDHRKLGEKFGSAFKLEPKMQSGCDFDELEHTDSPHTNVGVKRTSDGTVSSGVTGKIATCDRCAWNNAPPTFDAATNKANEAAEGYCWYDRDYREVQTTTDLIGDKKAFINAFDTHVLGYAGSGKTTSARWIPSYRRAEQVVSPCGSCGTGQPHPYDLFVEVAEWIFDETEPIVFNRCCRMYRDNDNYWISDDSSCGDRGIANIVTSTICADYACSGPDQLQRHTTEEQEVCPSNGKCTTYGDSQWVYASNGETPPQTWLPIPMTGSCTYYGGVLKKGQPKKSVFIGNGTATCQEHCKSKGETSFEYIDNSCDHIGDGKANCKEPKKADFSSCCACGDNTCYDHMHAGVGSEAWISSGYRSALGVVSVVGMVAVGALLA